MRVDDQERGVGDRAVPVADRTLMAGTATARSWLSLPGFADGAVPFALRTGLALVLAYYVAFAAQVASPSSAGVTVGIIAQASTGMALSKAFYRVLGTALGFVVSIALAACFGQDRTVLLLAFAVWMSLCAAAASLLRDFRSYGAALSGYTVAIIAIGSIDDPDGLFLAGMNRAAAVVIGILSVAVVNLLLGGPAALDGLRAALRRNQAAVTALALDALEGRAGPDGPSLARTAAAITALDTEATYAAAEQPDGRRRNGARVTIGSLLIVISAARTIHGADVAAAGSGARRFLDEVAATIRAGRSAPEPPPLDRTGPQDTLLIERAEAIARHLADAGRGLQVLAGEPGVLPRTVLRPTVDLAAAFIAAARSLLAFGAAATFIVLAGWPGATLVLIQQAAFTGLLGTLPAPSRAALTFAVPLLPMTLFAAAIVFGLLPLASGFVPFALAVGPAMAALALLGQQARLARYAAPALIYFTILVSPSNPQTYDPTVFLDTMLEVATATAFTVLAFVYILPASPKRRLYRITTDVARDLRRTRRRILHHTGTAQAFDPAVAQARLFDRLARALVWLGPATGARTRFLAHTYRLGAADIALQRAHLGLQQALAAAPGLAATAAVARRALNEPECHGLHHAARDLLAHPDAPAAAAAVRQTVSGMMDLVFQEGPDHGVSRFHRFVAD